MEKDLKYWHAMSDSRILELLGGFIQKIRLEQNKTQQQVATDAGLNRSTMVHIEKGDGGTMLSFIQILRALELLQLFENFEVKQQISPLQLAKMEHQKRQRARVENGADTKKTTTDW